MIEIIIYLIIGCILMSLRRVLSGMKNGCFYHKNDNPLPIYLKTYIKNLHFIETPAWYTQFGGMFFFVFSIARMFNPEFDWHIIWQILSAYMITVGTSASANYFYQRGVVAGLRDGKNLDAFDGNQTEFALKIGRWKMQFWRTQLFYNNGRIIASFLGVLEIIAGILIMYYFI